MSATPRAAARSLALVVGLAACKDPPPLPPPATSAPIASTSAPAPAPPAPIEATLPDSAPPPLDRRAECARGTCTLSHLVPDEVRPTLSDGRPMVIWEQALGERASLTFPRDEVVELCGVVLDGAIDVTPLEGPSGLRVGGRWSGFRAPGGGVTLTVSPGKAARVALVVATQGVGLGPHLEQRDRPGAPPSWSWKARPKRIDVVSFTDRPVLTWGSGAYHARIGWEASTYRLGAPGARGVEVDDRPAAMVDLLRFSADAGVAEHTHEQAWEALAVLEGQGTLVRVGADKTERLAVRPGTLVTIPAGVRHAWIPSGKAPFLAIQVYGPPGPEQRFKELAGVKP